MLCLKIRRKMHYKFNTEEQSIRHTTIITLCSLSIHPVESNGHLTVSKEPKEHTV